MTAASRIRLLRSRIGEIREAEKYAQDADALEHARAELQAHRSALQSAIATASVLVNNDLLNPRVLPSPQKANALLAKTSEAFGADPGSVTRGRGFTTLRSLLDDLSKAVMDKATEAWTQEVSKAPKTNDALLNKIARLRDQAQTVRDLRLASENLAEIMKGPPADEAAWLNYKSLRHLVDEQVNALSAANFPRAALDFCIAAQSQGAQLSMLTDDVRAWLEKQGLLDELRYRFS